MTSAFQQVYMAAMTLNNIGISLLHRQADEKAIKMLSSAIALMREISNGDSLAESPLVVSIKAKLEYANQMLAVCPLSSHLSYLHVIMLQDIFDVVKNLYPEVPKADEPPPLVLIRIESFVDDEENYNFNFESSIILYNFGTAYLQMSGKTGQGATAFVESACRLFHLSYSILEKELTIQDQSDLKRQILPFMIHVLQCLVHTTSMLGHSSYSSVLSSSIGSLHQALQWDYEISAHFPPYPAKAA